MEPPKRKFDDLLRNRPLRQRPVEPTPSPRARPIPPRPMQPPVVRPTPPTSPETGTDHADTAQQLAAQLAQEKQKQDQAKLARRAHRKRAVGRSAGFLKALPIALVRLIQPLTRQKHRKKVMVGSVLLVIGVAVFVFTRPNPSPLSTTPLGGGGQPPNFNTLEPNNDITKTQSGAIAFDATKNVASFTDIIGDVKVTVSQQPQPEPFAADPKGELFKFATNINASEKLEVGDIDVYIGTSAKGPQTVVFIKNNNLVFIGAESRLPYEELQAYIKDLD